MSESNLTAEKKLQFTTSEACANQRKLCEEKGYPHFAPGDGICYDCRRQIYLHPRANDESDKSLITGCYYCFYSYCE